MALTWHFLKTWAQQHLGPAGCVQPPRSYSSSQQRHSAGIRKRLKPLKALLRGNLPGISEAADTSRQPHLERFNWEGWESRGSLGRA